jgi:hypothetical protein
MTSYRRIFDYIWGTLTQGAFIYAIIFTPLSRVKRGDWWVGYYLRDPNLKGISKQAEDREYSYPFNSLQGYSCQLSRPLVRKMVVFGPPVYHAIITLHWRCQNLVCPMRQSCPSFSGLRNKINSILMNHNKAIMRHGRIKQKV